MNYLKQPIFRSESYRRFVASFPCFNCGIEGYSQCAHANRGKGLGLKVSDLDTFPLCSARPGNIGCHQAHDLCIGMTLEQRREREDGYVLRMRSLAINNGRRELRNTE